jgi:hypothetical protein
MLNKETTMRDLRYFCRLLSIFALTIAPLITVANAAAQELAHGEKPLPTVDDIAAMLGQSLANVFAKYGAPADVFVTGADTKTPSVIADFSKFGFEIRDKKVIECEFWLGWPGPVMGAKIGDVADDIVKEMGQPAEDIKNADGTELMEWHNSDKKIKISIAFNKKHKSTGLMLESN